MEIMKRLFFAMIIIFLSHSIIYGQISTEEKPISFRTNIPDIRINANTQKILPQLDMSKIEREDIEDEENGIPPRFGYKHEVDYDLSNSGEWTIMFDGSKIWRLSISCPMALSINILYDKFWIPEGSKFFVYSNDHRYSIGAFTSENNKGEKDFIQGFATGLIYSDQVILEYFLPSEVNEVGVISIAYVVQGYRYILLPENNRGYGDSGNCQVNINCREGQDWQNEKNAVAMILVNGNRYCTGSLINTTANDNRPLFLTADHCLGGWANNNVKYDAIGNPNLDHYSFCWHYESPDCTNSVPVFKETVGAMVTANNDASDFALLKLKEDPAKKIGVTPYYLGWDCSGNTGTGGVGIHHPSGDIKKIATHNMIPQSNGNFWHLYWMQTPNGYSVTEGGSSGSSLINNNRRVIGQLYGGSSLNCSDPANDLAMYGKFCVSWTGNDALDSRRRLKDWLDPNNTGTTFLNGIATCVNNFVNQVITLNQTIIGCGTLNIKDVEINNSATVIITAGEEVIIKPGFHATVGTNVVISIGSYASIQSQSSMLFANNEPQLEEPSLQSLAINNKDFTNQTPNFILHPNPNQGIFQLETNFPLSAIGNLKITNLMGATVYETQNVVSNMVQLQNPTAGTFFVVMVLKDGAVITRKMVVQ